MTDCLEVLEKGLTKFSYAPELIAQQTYINKCFGIKKNARLLIQEDIFYSDDESPLVHSDNENTLKGDPNFVET
jgi:hypothetical protein